MNKSVSTTKMSISMTYSIVFHLRNVIASCKPKISEVEVKQNFGSFQ